MATANRMFAASPSKDKAASEWPMVEANQKDVDLAKLG
jgi:hypothetical protein